MATRVVSQLLWFKILGVHLHQFSFANPMEFLASVVHENNKLGASFMPLEKHKINVAAALILKRVWEVKCEVFFY